MYRHNAEFDVIQLESQTQTLGRISPFMILREGARARCIRIFLPYKGTFEYTEGQHYTSRKQIATKSDCMTQPGTASGKLKARHSHACRAWLARYSQSCNRL